MRSSVLSIKISSVYIIAGPLCISRADPRRTSERCHYENHTTIQGASKKNWHPLMVEIGLNIFRDLYEVWTRFPEFDSVFKQSEKNHCVKIFSKFFFLFNCVDAYLDVIEIYMLCYMHQFWATKKSLVVLAETR